MTTKTIILGAFATAAIFTATAASAAPAAGVTRTTPDAASRLDRPDQRYCIVSDVTGSRIPQRECRQLGDWQDMGIDPRLMPRRR